MSRCLKLSLFVVASFIVFISYAIFPFPAAAVDARYVGADLCKQCHSSRYESWAKTAHAKDFANFPYAGRAINKYTYARGECASCHVLGYGEPGGYAKDKPWNEQAALLRVQCESCHGPGSAHAVAVTAAERRATIAVKPEPLKTCMKCHVTSYGDFPTSSAKDKDLAITPRRQGAMLYGINGYEYPGTSYVSSQHKNVVEGACIACHVSRVRPHELKADLESCQPCHGGATNFNINGRQEEIKGLLASLKSVLDSFKKAHSTTTKDQAGKDVVRWDNPQNKLAYERALYNYNFVNLDGSKGVHNYKYARQLLADSSANLPK